MRGLKDKILNPGLKSELCWSVNVVDTCQSTATADHNDTHSVFTHKLSGLDIRGENISINHVHLADCLCLIEFGFLESNKATVIDMKLMNIALTLTPQFKTTKNSRCNKIHRRAHF